MKRTNWHCAAVQGVQAGDGPAAERAAPLCSAEEWSGGALPAPLLCLPTVSTVLDVAHQRAAEDLLPPWSSVLACSQTEGRGQMRRHWHSPVGNIFAAVRLPYEAPFLGTEAAPALGGLVVAVLQGMVAPTLELRLKWPNDVVLMRAGRPCKVGGILLEERGGCIVAGMGLNVAHAPEESQLRRDHAMPAACLKDADAAFDNAGTADENADWTAARSLWVQLVSGMYFWYTKKFPAPFPWRPLAEERLLWKNHPVRLCDDDGDARGLLLGIGPAGGVRLAVGGRTQEFLGGSLQAATT